MWNKANRVLAMENGVTSAPGVDKKARMVLSLTSEPLILSEAEPKASMCVMPVVVAGV